MRILLFQHAPYVPALGGANRSNRLLLEALVERGHTCRAIVSAAPVKGAAGREALRTELLGRGVKWQDLDLDLMAFSIGPVEVRAMPELRRLRHIAAQQVAEFRPDWVLVSSEDPGQMLLEAAVRAAARRVVYLARTTLALPCGPEAALRNEAKTDLLRKAAAIVCVSPYMRRYINRWTGLEAVALPLSLWGPGPLPEPAPSFGPHVTMINPSAVKGIAIFLALAQRMPDVSFAAVPTWGTTSKDLGALQELPNVTIMAARDDVDEIYRQTRILLVPSLWAEGHGRVVTEAHLRGIPVLAADVGGLPDQMAGLQYVLPVNAIQEYRAELDEQLIPEAIVPPQDVGPWEAALRALLRDGDHFASLSRDSRLRALERAAATTIEPLESFLLGLRPGAERAPVAAPSPVSIAARPRLTSEQRAYVASRLRTQRKA
jgi:glycosyltransferase involved in cell wall biosynthesis